MSDVSFVAYDGDATIPYEFVMQDKLPVKLGDGTFGCVFHIRGRGRNCALKVFYATKDEFVLKGQEQEMSIGTSLKKKYIDDHSVSAAIDQYLVVATASLSNFTETPAYETLKSYFESLSFKISPKAIVMDFYPMSLKDLLERGWPESKQSDKPNGQQGKEAVQDIPDAAIGRAAGGKFGERSGYTILRSLSQSNREACILPLIKDVAQGLAILHGADFRHQDMKPANVLVRQVAGDLRGAVADLGFIDTGTFQVHGSMWQHRPLGTRHYRSPEQTDFFDVCEVDVTTEDDGLYVLETRDPKFLTTFSEKGDLVVFAKLPEPVQWEIAELTMPKGQSADVWKEEPIRIKIEALDKYVLKPDERTQISVNKKQTARTDLFGLGGIIYDMLTCGRSPEQFYDLLRTHDREGEEIESGLGQRYLHFRNGGGTVPEIDAVFQNLRVDAGSDFPALGIVKILLKCMMSRADDSYFNDREAVGIWESVRADLEEFEKASISEDNHRRIAVNYLTSPGRFRDVISIPVKMEPASLLAELQALSYQNQDESVKRLVKGIGFFNRVAGMIGKELVGGSGFSYLADVSPENLTVSRGDFVPQYAFFETEKDLEALFASGNPKVVMQTFAAGTLLPPFLGSLVRDCEIWTERGDLIEKCEKVFVDSWGADLGWGQYSPGDRLSFDFSPTETVNATIVEHKNGVLAVKWEEESYLGAKLHEWIRYKAIIVRKFLPSDYYVSMLGLYIRQIFFVNPTDRRKFIPQAIFGYEQERAGGRVIATQEGKITPSSGAIFSFSGARRQGGLEEFFAYLARVCVRLMSRDVVGPDIRKKYSVPVERPGQVVQEIVGEINARAGVALGCDPNKLAAGGEEALIEELKGKRLRAERFPDVEELTKRAVDAWRTR